MPKAIILLIIALIIVGGFIVFYKPKPTHAPADDSPQPSNIEQTWKSQTDEQGSVTVAVTPIDLRVDTNEWTFDVVMDTHSVELGQDMIQSASLYDDQGREYKPTRWDGPSGGHHREGVLIFKPITPALNSIELKIKDVGGIPERSFKWEIHKII